MNTTGPYWWQVNIGPCNGLVPPSNKPQPQPVLIQIYSPHGIARPQWVNSLWHSGIVTPYGDRDLSQHWLKKWLVAWLHQAITRTYVDLSSSDIHIMAISQEMPQPSFTKIRFKITFLKFHPNFPEANVLISRLLMTWQHKKPSNGSWCIGIKGEMSGTVCVTFTWDIYIYMSCL